MITLTGPSGDVPLPVVKSGSKLKWKKLFPAAGGLLNARAAVAAASADPQGPPTLSLSRKSVDFGTQATTQTVLVRNTGTGAITIDGVTNTEESGGNWLSASVDASTTPASLTLTVNRSAFAPGLATAGRSASPRRPDRRPFE